MAAAVALAVQPALWVLQYVSASTGRLAMLATWVGLLAAALPLMNRMAHSPSVPTIIVRKVSDVLSCSQISRCVCSVPTIVVRKASAGRLCSCRMRHATGLPAVRCGKVRSGAALYVCSCSVSELSQIMLS